MQKFTCEKWINWYKNFKNQKNEEKKHLNCLSQIKYYSNKLFNSVKHTSWYFVHRKENTFSLLAILIAFRSDIQAEMSFQYPFSRYE